MADWKLLAAAGGIAALLLAGWFSWTATRAPRDPAQLFRKRCSNCHKLPDLSPFRSADMSRIVRTMREKNGADKVISEAEAQTIVKYLEETAGK